MNYYYYLSLGLFTASIVCFIFAWINHNRAERERLNPEYTTDDGHRLRESRAGYLNEKTTLIRTGIGFGILAIVCLIWGLLQLEPNSVSYLSRSF